MRGSHEDRKTGVVQEVSGFDTVAPSRAGCSSMATADKVKQAWWDCSWILLILDQSESEQNDDWAERGVNF